MTSLTTEEDIVSVVIIFIPHKEPAPDGVPRWFSNFQKNQGHLSFM